MSVSVWNKRINLWLQVKYSILCMNNVVLLCSLFINPGFCLQFCQSIPWHTLWQTWLFLFCYDLHLLPGMKPVTSSSLRYIWRLYVILRIWCWSENQNQSRWAGQFLAWHAGHAKPTGFTIGTPGMPNQRSKNWAWIINPARDLGPKFSWVNFGLRGHEPIFSMPICDVISKYQCSLEFCHA